MSTGAERAEAQPYDGTGLGEEEWNALPEEDHHSFEEETAPAPGGGAWPKLLAAFLTLAAAAWIGAAGWAAAESRPFATLAGGLGWIATASVPLVLLGLAWLLFGRSSRRETERFTAAVAAMRGESAALETVLAIVAARLEENRSRLGEEAGRLMALGDEASDRLGRVTHYLARETAELDRKSQALESAAASAKVDIGVLLQDLPRAEEQARGLTGALREAGLSAHQQAGALEGQLSAIVARSREADEVVGGGAQRLGAHLARIDGNAGAAAERIEQAAQSMNAAVDGALERASEASGEIRASLDAQGRTMLALIEQSRAGFQEAGDEASRGLAERLDTVGARLADLASELAAQDEASRALVGGLAAEFEALDARLSALGRNGEDRREALTRAVEEVRTGVRALQAELDDGGERANELAGRTRAMSEALAVLTSQLHSELPQALHDVEQQAEKAVGTARAMAPDVENVRAAAVQAAESLSEGELSIGRQREAVDALVRAVADGVRGAEEQLRALGGAVGEADANAARLTADTAPELIDALVRVRDAAAQAANHAREAIAAVIPESVDRLAEASRDALSEAVSEPVAEQLARLELVGEGAVAAARKASERLMRQLLTLGEAAAAIEARFDEERKEREEKDGETLSRRVALLIESLNSTAIDVTKILSNEVTDSAWTAYLKGDRGVFTRRAVRLLEYREAREILRHYEEEPEFREQVNRYIHDFEALLRRVLSGSEGTPLGVTLLSSDMGKLYVALAQAIERIRK